MINTGNVSTKNAIHSIITHCDKFRVQNYSLVSEEVQDAWKFFTSDLLPRISSKWNDEIQFIKSGVAGTKQFSVVTLSDEAFVVYVLSLYLDSWKVPSDYSIQGEKKRADRKKLLKLALWMTNRNCKII